MKNIKFLYREFLREKIHDYRKNNSLSQETMAELLHISPRSYFNQEHGKYGFSALTLTFFLRSLSDREISNFLNDFDRFWKNTNS